MAGALFVIDRGLEEVEWWSVYQLGTGKHLFDTYVPLGGFSISREMFERRYLGLEIPPDDANDARLKQPNLAGVVTYASADGLKREALLTCDDAKQAQLLRSYVDSTRTVSLIEGPPPHASGFCLARAPRSGQSIDADDSAGRRRFGSDARRSTQRPARGALEALKLGRRCSPVTTPTLPEDKLKHVPPCPSTDVKVLAAGASRSSPAAHEPRCSGRRR